MGPRGKEKVSLPTRIQQKGGEPQASAATKTKKQNRSIRKHWGGATKSKKAREVTREDG